MTEKIITTIITIEGYTDGEATTQLRLKDTEGRVADVNIPTAACDEVLAGFGAVRAEIEAQGHGFGLTRAVLVLDDELDGWRRRRGAN